ncbi:MAG: hypothetical protein A2269_07810 [Lentisphaerae bacterium RIFOXYA12_FULL_60_10]|nr:MAG: hypothetical protein A2269_07810 [Lentisphaerae bacterium RIFOXYA12_FULL_60_10]
MKVRVRFAPSPTGNVHIGNIRAAIFNWLFARHEGGSFLLRIEDTDAERSTDEAKRTLLDAMEWLGLNGDEPIVYQSAQTAAHLAAAEDLVRRGQAYRRTSPDGTGAAVVFRMPAEGPDPVFIRSCGSKSAPVCPTEPFTVDGTGVRYSQVNRKGVAVPVEGCLAGYRNLRVLDASGACQFELAPLLDRILRKGESFTVEGAATINYEQREVVLPDLVKGKLTKPLEDMKDLVIVRSNGAPVFHLANVCDDIAQGITHIIRGDDHVENTYRHLFLFHALGHTPPGYAHLPMIVNAQGKPYSKRDGDAYVGDFKTKGFLPQALFNYLSLLGWSPGEDREKMTRDEAVRDFTLDRVKSGPAQMDLKKLTHLNWQYIADMPIDIFEQAVRGALGGMAWMQGVPPESFRAVCALMQSRCNTLQDPEGWQYFFADDYPREEKEAAKLLGREGMTAALERVALKLAPVEWTEAAIEAMIRDVERESGIPEGKLNQPVRVAVTGVTRGAGLYETMILVGRDRCRDRIVRAVRP